MELWLFCLVGFYSATSDYNLPEDSNKDGHSMLGEIRIEKQDVAGNWKLVIYSKYASEDSEEKRAAQLKKDLDLAEGKHPNSKIRAVSHTGAVLATR